ncbi:MAG: methyltransferase domain-containing protein [bacterium]|nr:methyltransferase domain-containing protein [bacterium]
MDEFNQRQSNYFDRYAQTPQAEVTQSPADQIEWQAFKAVIGDLKGKKVLDLGCGAGRYSIRCAEDAEEVIGTDLSPVSIELANQNAASRGLQNMKALVFDFKEIRWERYFDRAILVNMLHHTSEAEQILQNLSLSLKEDGSLVIFENNSMNPLFIPFFIKLGQLGSHWSRQYLRSNLFSLKKLLEANGFVVEEIHRYGFLPTGLYNRSLVFKKINDCLNRIPVVNWFTAFYIIRARPRP